MFKLCPKLRVTSVEDSSTLSPSCTYYFCKLLCGLLVFVLLKDTESLCVPKRQRLPKLCPNFWVISLLGPYLLIDHGRAQIAATLAVSRLEFSTSALRPLPLTVLS